MNFAATFVVPAIVKLQEPNPLQAPLQPANVQPAAGTSLRMTADPSRNVDVADAQVVPRRSPRGST